MKCIGVLQITLKSITKKDEYKDKLIDIDEGLFGPDEPLTNLINNLGKIIGSSYLILRKKFNWYWFHLIKNKYLCLYSKYIFYLFYLIRLNWQKLISFDVYK